ncbi:MAG: DNA-directed RNA polymerase subunit beta' [Anaerolineae bacterium]|nr:DNA-directed RNA polymerase subunit beta' [Anaerolineae bacterium]
MEAKEFRALRISLASPEQILSWSYGEVTKPETINYRRLRPEKDGLFCEVIFGPTRDYQCYCGKYKGPRYRGIVCEKCGVEITRATVRRERMGDIKLAAPVAHIWYTRRVPSYLGMLLDISRRNLDRVLYFAQYVITSVDEEARQRALKRLEEEFERERRSIELRYKKEIETLLSKIQKLEERERQKLADREARIEEKWESEVESLMREAQRTQARLEERLGKTIRAPIVFDPTGEVIADAGETVGREHLAALKRILDEQLNRIKEKEATERSRALAKTEETLKALREAVEEKIAALRDQAAREIEALRQRIQMERDELVSLAPLQFLGENKYRELKSKWGQVFKAEMGAEAFLEILQRLDLEQMAKELWQEIRQAKSKQRRKKAIKRLQIVRAFLRSGNRPEWMILRVLPVLPPDLRPMVQLDGGRFATSDLNDLYRRVINRNNRMRRLLDLNAPDVIIRNEKRMLQEAVDALIDNSQRGKAMSRRGRRELKSLSDMLRGKKGRFRRNLLGKRVDYSGRSVIVVGPQLKLHQCGLPKTMALELYKPFVIARLIQYNYAANIKGARRLVERQRPEVWEVLEEVIKGRPVLLNRAPTLHRLGIQAFEPVLVEGKAIQIHPLVCAAFNADFDGDQMAIHIPLSDMAVWEARNLMLSSKNLLLPANGEPVVGPTKDMVLGCYYMTMTMPNGEPASSRVFANLEEVELAYHLGKISLHTPIRVYTNTIYDENNQRYADGKPRRRLIETTVGRVLFNLILPEGLRFVNETMDKGRLKDLTAHCFQWLGREETVKLVDRLKDIGFRYATRSGVTIAVSDLPIPSAKREVLARYEALVAEVERQYRRGLLTEEERYNRVIDLWQRATNEIAEAVKQTISSDNNVAIMALSGATKGGFQPVAQLAGMRGLMADPTGRIIELPIRSNFREGLTTIEYFISTHGARKGLADTALRTADAGYLTRRLVDVAQDVIISAYDCGTRSGIWIRTTDDVGGQTLQERIFGRVLAAPVFDPRTGALIADTGTLVDEGLAERIARAGVQEVYVRSPMTCQVRHGICALCYGRDLGTGRLVEMGTAVGIIAAQSIGEPGTQLTLRTFHTGGVAGVADITQGLPRVEEIFEARRHPKGEGLMADIDGIVHIHRTEEGGRRIRIVKSEQKEDIYEIPGNWSIKVEDGQEIVEGQVLASRGEQQITAKHSGRVVYQKGEPLKVVYELREEREYEVPATARLLVEEGQQVKAGDTLTEGPKNPHRILRLLGREAVQLYLLSELQKVYRSQGVNINDKHFEVIIRKMLSKVQIINPGDTDFLPGDLVDRLVLQHIHAKLAAEGKRPAVAQQVLLGITKAALATDSFLSAASFQHTIRVLAGTALEGKIDELRGLKENVIIGRLIPAGTGFRYYAEKRGAESKSHSSTGPTLAEAVTTSIDL